MSDEELLLKNFTHEMKELESLGVTLALRLPPLQAMLLIGTLQLALRHPGFPASSAETVVQIVNKLESEFSHYRVPYTLKTIQLGWDAANDVEET